MECACSWRVLEWIFSYIFELKKEFKKIRALVSRICQYSHSFEEQTLNKIFCDGKKNLSFVLVCQCQ